jgi:hypothetical protein
MPNTPFPPNDAWAGAGQRLTPPPLGLAQEPAGGPNAKKNGFFGPVIAAVVFGF